MKIAVLADNLINRIAAGEVVERPASVVKELVDNSIDAGGKEISVWIEGNGTALIKVADDGEGMALEDLAVAFQRHSTSKIRRETDLEEISTLGFRGEALPSIASVATVEVLSRTAGQEHGGRLRVTNGDHDAPVEIVNLRLTGSVPLANVLPRQVVVNGSQTRPSTSSRS